MTPPDSNQVAASEKEQQQKASQQCQRLITCTASPCLFPVRASWAMASGGKPCPLLGRLRRSKRSRITRNL
ncbi:hypothetical protein Cni_G21007 [Canna indica]|uniref:Uncharacterized protein n=1 Tax=Canna indica TaxID=4628 RepID=A0AAQ3QKB5_9LILI|nr:hypothetical protein Cni_G21007 [Canna indica]